MPIIAQRYHDISCGHRVVGHEGKCKGLHGHNYRIHFTVTSLEGARSSDLLDDIGRVVDFGVIKSVLCNWLEEEWDHKMLLWVQDPLISDWLPAAYQHMIDDAAEFKGPNPVSKAFREAFGAVVPVSFNPTAENMALYLLRIKGPELLKGAGHTNLLLTHVRVEETRKCSAEAQLEHFH